MAYEPINLGDGISREPLGSALKKIDTMLSELYVTIPEGDFSAISQNIVPDQDLQYNLGSETNRWHSLYVGSGSVYIGDAKLSATTNGQIILPGVYDPSLHQAVEVYAEEGISQGRTWGDPNTVIIIDAFTWAALGQQTVTLIPSEWLPASYSATLDAEGYIDGASVIEGGNEYSDIDINGINNVATICTDYMYVYIGNNIADPFTSFVADDWTQIPFAVRCQATGVNLSTSIGESVSYNDLLDLPDQSLNTTNSVEFLSVTAGSVETSEVAAAATLTLTAGSTSVTLNNQGVMTFPQILQFTSNNSSWPGRVGWAQGISKVLLDSPTDVVIQTDNDGDGVLPTWTFGANSRLTLPSGGSVDLDGAVISGSELVRNIDQDFNIKSAGTDGSIVFNWGLTHSAYSNKITIDTAGVKLTTDTSKNFTFSTDGSVTLPNNSIINAGSAANGNASVGWKEFLAGPTIGWGLYAENDIYIQTFNDITKPTWVFKENGTTQFPSFTFPSTDGTVGQVLATNGSGTLAWTTIAGGGGSDISTSSINDLADVNVSGPVTGQVLKWNGSAWINDTDANSGGGGTGTLASRTTRSITTASLANLASANATITGFTGYALLSIQTSAAAWVTVYTSSAARTADAGRVITDDPTPGSGVIAEVITTGAQTQTFTPGVFGYNDETVPTTDIQIKVVNRSGSAAAITVTVKLLQLEA
jgi:hypothetical protein